MHFALATNFRRISLDYAAKLGGTYAATPHGFNYGSCVAGPQAMTPLATVTEAKDECPETFPTSVTPTATIVNFDLEHATSNKNVDPAYNQLTVDGTGSAITNTAFYAFRTNNTGGDLLVDINNYTTAPAPVASCVPPASLPVTGVQMAIYQVSACPTAQSYPTPVKYLTFQGDGSVSPITGLSANSNYLVVVDGIENTKANFNMVFSGAALSSRPVNLDGSIVNAANLLSWNTDPGGDIDSMTLERSTDGVNFTDITTVDEVNWQQGEYADKRPVPGDNFYRLAVHNINGSVQYSSVVTLTREDAFIVTVYPNPAGQKLNVEILNNKPGKYSIVMYNSNGQQVMQKEVTVTGKGTC